MGEKICDEIHDETQTNRTSAFCCHRLALAVVFMQLQLNILIILPCFHCFVVLTPVHSCVPGVNRPSLLTPTPLHGDVHHAAVGHVHIISLRAQSSHNRSEICIVQNKTKRNPATTFLNISKVQSTNMHFCINSELSDAGPVLQGCQSLLNTL